MTPPDPPDEPTTPVLVDWTVAGRRLRTSAVVLLGLAVVAWLVAGVLHGAVRLADVWGYLGLAAVGMFLAEVVVVGGSAARGLLRAGERGERLAGADVGLLPPQLTRRHRDRDRAR